MAGSLTEEWYNSRSDENLVWFYRLELKELGEKGVVLFDKRLRNRFRVFNLLKLVHVGGGRPHRFVLTDKCRTMLDSLD